MNTTPDYTKNQKKAIWRHSLGHTKLARRGLARKLCSNTPGTADPWTTTDTRRFEWQNLPHLKDRLKNGNIFGTDEGDRNSGTRPSHNVFFCVVWFLFVKSSFIRTTFRDS